MIRITLFVCLMMSIRIFGAPLRETPKQSIESLAEDSAPLNVKRITGVNDSYPALSPDGQTLLFQSDRSGDVEIWSIRADGTGLKKLTDSKGYDGNPSWSPDGKTIAFTSTRDKDQEVYIMNADGSGQKRITSAKGDDGHPHWYPDGSRIIFNSARTSDFTAKKYADEIFSMKPDGSDVKQLTDLKSVSTYASVSPDGKKIVFRGSTATPAYRWDMTTKPDYTNSEIFAMDADGKNIVNVTNSPSFDGWPSWSPDSKKIVFASNRSGKPNAGQLYSVNVNGSGFQQLTDLPGAVTQPFWSADGKAVYGYQSWETPGEEYGYIVKVPVSINDAGVDVGTPKFFTSVIDCYPVLSPDGKTVIFRSNRDGDWDIYTVDTAGKNLKQLTNTPGDDAGPVWSPDGSLIAFVSERDKNPEIYTMKPDGSEQTRLTNWPGDDSHPHWFPDGRIIFNSSINTPDTTKEWSLQFHDVYSMTKDGKDVRRLTDNKTVTTYPSASPDGRKIAFRKVTDAPAINWDMTLNKRGRNSEVFVMDLETKQQVNVSSHFAFDGWPAWARDSKSIIFVSNKNGKAGGGQLFIANTDGTNMRQLTDLPGAIIQHSVSVDDRYIFAYQSFENADVEYGNIVRIEIP